MPRPAYTESENEQVRQMLIDGALELFREQGLEQLSLRKLATRMNMSHTKLYRYFANKEALLLTVKMASLEILHRMLTDTDTPDADPLSRLRIAGHSLQQFATRYQKDYHFLFSIAQSDDETNTPLLELRHQVFDFVVSLAEQASKANLIHADPRTHANLAWATLHGAISLNANNQLLEGSKFENVIEGALDLLFGPPPVVHGDRVLEPVGSS